ncbi:long-chain fatty acid transport protein [Crenobacter luteus]|uniref:OmpP1/FadL family transporter n=1 Tax=Crenobacter luteus TaxID=1452487 RepID=UPI00104AB8BF|nr:OmpP1/FadL family transporter [Crenobacter luteus]TCP12095.1 long-chain fatty acid transport protein [Crenobacter luteus]
MKLKQLSLSVMLLGSAASLFSAQAVASGYHFGTQSVSAQATANASAAEAADASTIFYNAAGMSKLSGTQVSGALNLVAPSVKYRNAQGFYPGAPGAQQAIQGRDSGKLTDDLVAVPHLYLTHKIDERFAVGVGVYVPYASETEYQRDSVLRYNVNQTGLKTLDVNPALSIKLNEQHAFGVGLLAQYAKATLRQFANFGAFPGGGGNGANDGYAEVEGDDWGFGFTAGWLWDVSDRSRVGLSYRSKVKHTLDGTAKWSKSAAYSTTPNALGYKDNEGAKVDVVTPESLSLHGMHRLDPRWNLFGDVTWTRHSRFDRVQIEYENTKVVNGSTSNKTILVPDWKDTYKVSLGASYQVTDPLQLRFGVAYDQSPVPDDAHRLSTLPDNDRIWLSLGGKYELSKQSSVNLAYSYIHIKDAKANVNGYCGGANAAAVACVSSKTNGSAEYRSHAQIVGVQYNHSF